jgi:citrate lyase subunit beta / citryl-CoA lyase
MDDVRHLGFASPPARRSCLSVPASAPGKLVKARDLGADEVVIDLEDSVAVAAKDEARAAAVEALGGWGHQTVSVRVNPPRSRWCHLELAALAEMTYQPRSIVVPKVESAGDLAFLDRLLDGWAGGGGRPPAAATGSGSDREPAGLANVDEIAGSSQRLETLILGYADLGASLGRSAAGAGALDLWLGAQDAVLVAARGHGLQAIDGPFLGTAPDRSFHAAASRARDLGFDGKWAIHPSQIKALNELFSPTEAELAHARAVIAALERGGRESNAGAVALDGEMLDEAVRRSAIRVLARAVSTGDQR